MMDIFGGDRTPVLAYPGGVSRIIFVQTTGSRRPTAQGKFATHHRTGSRAVYRVVIDLFTQV